jgi:hypothetical protein
LESLLSKDHLPEKLGEKVATLTKKLKFIRQCKEGELNEMRAKERAKRETLQQETSGLVVGGRSNIG